MSTYEKITPTKESDVQTIFEHATRLALPLDPSDSGCVGRPKVLVPADFKLVDLEGWRPVNPPLVEEIVETPDLESFIRYLKDFEDPRLALFVTAGPITGSECRVNAVIDYHEGGSPGWCKFQCTWKPQLAVEWLRWTGLNGKKLTQVDFARFLEDNHAAVVSPAGADLLAIANTFKVSGSVTYNKAITLQNGNISFAYVDQRKATGGVGEMEVPERFVLEIPVFFRGVKFNFEVKLRYKVTEQGELVLWLEMVNLDLVWQAAVDAVVEHLGKQGFHRLYIGSRGK